MRNEEQARRLGELEARVALLEQEARSQRSPSRTRPTETIRIGGARRGDSSELRETERLESEEPGSLRLTSMRAPEPEAWEPPVLPPGVPGTLPVVPLPDAPVTLASVPVSARAPEPAPAPVAPDAARAQYRAALRLLQGRQFDEASKAFGDWITAYPSHALIDDAMYWQAEAHYALRRYREALERFEGVVGRFPDTARLPDALVKIGLCRRHLGDADGARESFQRVRAEFPGSDAARLVPAEGAS